MTLRPLALTTVSRSTPSSMGNAASLKHLIAAGSSGGP